MLRIMKGPNKKTFLALCDNAGNRVYSGYVINLSDCLFCNGVDIRNKEIPLQRYQYLSVIYEE